MREGNRVGSSFSVTVCGSEGLAQQSSASCGPHLFGKSGDPNQKIRHPSQQHLQLSGREESAIDQRS